MVKLIPILENIELNKTEDIIVKLINKKTKYLISKF